MSTSALSKRSPLSGLVNNLFNTTSVFGPRIWDFDNEFFDFDLVPNFPPVNIIENGKDFKIEMAAPGLEKKDFKVSVDNGILNIKGEKEEEKKEEKESYRRKEYSYNSFSRSLRLPDNCITDKIDAKYENGVLSISLPKKEITPVKAPKEIKVS